MKHRDLIGRIAAAARGADRTFKLLRQGREHEVWELGGVRVTIPRHREINQVTAMTIMRAFAAELGEGWWRQ